jgi:putative transposase
VGVKRGKNPTDRAKLGCKRHVLTDGKGIPLAVVVTGANRHDCPVLSVLLDAVLLEKASTTWVTSHLCLDAGYISPDTAGIALEKGWIAHVRSRGEEKEEKMAGKSPKRWVVERTHSWMNQYRRLLIRWEKQDALYLGFLQLAFCYLILERLH